MASGPATPAGRAGGDAVSTEVALFCRNEAARVRAALAGLRSQAGALPPASLPLRVVVLENGSSDATARVAREAAADLACPGVFEIEIREQLPAGKSRTWNTFLAAAISEVVAFVDADARLAPGTLAALIARLQSAPGLDLVGAWPALAPDFRARGFWQRAFAVPYRDLRPPPSLAGCAYVARRAALWPLAGDELNEDLALSLRHAGRVEIHAPAQVYVDPPSSLPAFLRQRARIRRGDRRERARAGTDLALHRRRTVADVIAYGRAAGPVALAAFLLASAVAAVLAYAPDRTSGWEPADPR
jgi:cellulose synthase/poly-beta-1,6-N-acetylglucosamine synthase-like glycosyltransferase